jgi:hypothetical protein
VSSFITSVIDQPRAGTQLSILGGSSLLLGDINWHFEETSGGVLHSTDGAHNLSNNGSNVVGGSAGHRGLCVAYNSSAGGLSSNNSWSVNDMANNGSSFAIAFWFKPSAHVLEFGVNRFLLGCGDDGGASPGLYTFFLNYQDTSASMNMSWWDGSGASFGGSFGSIDTATPTWHFAVLTFDYTNGTWEFYMDGSLQTSGLTDTGPVNPTPFYDSFYVMEDALGSDKNDGLIDEIMFFRRHVTAAEVTTMYHQ